MRLAIENEIELPRPAITPVWQITTYARPQDKGGKLVSPRIARPKANAPKAGAGTGQDASEDASPSKDAGEDARAFLAEKEEEYSELFANPYQAAKYGYIDDVIEPRNTRFRICRALAQLATKRQNLPAKKHGNIPM